jgi:hypothetical protein
MKKIIFTNVLGAQEEFRPKPSTHFIPEWYKEVNSYTGGKKRPSGTGGTTATIKRCMPVFDSITQGYIITTYSDIFVSQEEIQLEDGTLKKVPWYEWKSGDTIQFHSESQAPNHPDYMGSIYPKLINPWGIKTPRGYSTLFIPPTHRSNVFTIMEGVVDTDKYTSPVNFPMVLTDINFEGLVPAGTPIVQVIPFKRDTWKSFNGNDKDFLEQENTQKKLRTRFFDSYKNQFRESKEYK